MKKKKNNQFSFGDNIHIVTHIGRLWFIYTREANQPTLSNTTTKYK